MRTVRAAMWSPGSGMGWGEGKLCLSCQTPTLLGKGQLCSCCLPALSLSRVCWVRLLPSTSSAAPPGRFLVMSRACVSSRLTQAHASCFSSPATVVGLFECDLRTLQDLAVTWKLLATRASPQLSFLRDALTLKALFAGQPGKCLLFTAMPKIPVNIYEPICHGFSYDGKKVLFF